MQTQPESNPGADPLGDMTLDQLLLTVRLSRMSEDQIDELTRLAGLDR